MIMKPIRNEKCFPFNLQVTILWNLHLHLISFLIIQILDIKAYYEIRILHFL